MRISVPPLPSENTFQFGVVQSNVTPGLREIAIPPMLCVPLVNSSSRRSAWRRLRNGQLRADHWAHSRWLGGSDETRLMAHIGPMTKVPLKSSGSPHTQQSRLLSALECLRGSIARNSGLSLIHATNHGTGKPRSTASLAIRAVGASSHDLSVDTGHFICVTGYSLAVVSFIRRRVSPKPKRERRDSFEREESREEAVRGKGDIICNALKPEVAQE